MPPKPEVACLLNNTCRPLTTGSRVKTGIHQRRSCVHMTGNSFIQIPSALRVISAESRVDLNIFP